jgi:hypothetical protein
MEPVAQQIIAFLKKTRNILEGDVTMPYRERVSSVRTISAVIAQLELIYAPAPSPTPSTNPREVPDHRDQNPTDAV